MLNQLNIEFTPRAIGGKKTARLAIPCSEDMLNVIDMLARKHDTSRAELSFGWIVESIQQAMGNLFMTELHSDKPLKELLRR